MLNIYFDMNVYNRMFDDQSQLRIRFESMAIDIIFELIEKEQYDLTWSFVLDYENNNNPFINRKKYIESLSSICKMTIIPDMKIKELAKAIMDKSNAKSKDSLHLACAIHGGCNYFITCDDKFIKTIDKNREKLIEALGEVRLFNPIDFLRKEMEIDVIE